jgi:hypothetical protein
MKAPSLVATAIVSGGAAVAKPVSRLAVFLREQGIEV